MDEFAEVTFAYQPLLSTRTGGLVAVEALARPIRGTIHHVLRRAHQAGRLVDADIALAARAVAESANDERRLPLHLNVLAVTATHAEALIDALTEPIRRTERRPRDIVLEIGGPFFRLPYKEFTEGVATLRGHGFMIAFDGLGDGDMPLSLLAEVSPEMVKLDHSVVGGVPDDPGAVAVVEALALMAERTGIRLAAVGVESEAQLVALSRLGVRVAQGDLLASAARTTDPTTEDTHPSIDLSKLDTSTTVVRGTTVPLVGDFLHPPTTAPIVATSEKVRELFAEHDEINGVVLLDELDRPVKSVDRSRFLIAVTGPYGHALHAKRDAARHADQPRVIRADATALQLLELVGDADWERTGDDVVVVDEVGRCVGIVRVTEVVRGVAELKIEQAAALNPLTRLPGTDSVAREIDRRIGADEMFVVAWLDIDSFKAVNDTVGFAAGDDLIRAVGRSLSDAEATMPGVRVGHVGGDDFLMVCEVDEIASLAAGLVDREWSVEGRTVSVSLASLVCRVGSVTSFREASRLLAPLKKQAKAVAGSSWVSGRPGSDRSDVLRGRAARPNPNGHRIPAPALTRP
ncbi:diguanylate cyclase/phosphodiesterase [Herbihabitans rhizosphaerae]|uniref:Diguanylate cyclase/phosphodiesterase n=1 Tax=Herbihabitans rhizosphaerae TaxID=1872711 RepID=A0A4Q7L3N6_9PSEU|nr:EAL domain-containing protein [Herbihabitans rhizosphaerae]RZS43360.1 diguanylate cyclase/phosphodiesterase [Herbihabitans rhizosphaerae]